jgi:hypothetical protein
MRHFKSKWVVPIFFLIVFGSFLLSGCAGSQEKLELTGFLETYEKLINDFTVSYDAADKKKKTEMANQISAMTTTWVEKRNEMNDQITPQAMDELVKEYDRITSKYTAFNKTHLG